MTVQKQNVPETAIRESPPAPRLSGVDGLRGLAALIVLVFHVYATAGGPELRVWHHVNILRPLTDGWAAVNLFLVLSGFCLFWPFAARANRSTRPLRVRDYAARRVLRILPTYYASLGFVTFLGLTWPPLRDSEPHCIPKGWGDVIGHLFLLQAWMPSAINSWNSVTWSLSVEWTWYAGFPLAMLLFRRVGAVRGLIVLTALTVAYRVGIFLAIGPGNRMTTNVAWAWRTFLPGRLFEFGVGMAVAAFICSGRELARPARHALTVAVAGVLVAARLSEPIDVLLPVRDILYGTASAILLLLVTLPGPGKVKWIFQHPVFVWLGGFSYTLYLFHLAFVTIGSIYLRSLGFDGLRLFGVMLLTTPVTLAACWGLYFLVERPFLVRLPRPPVLPVVAAA